LSTDVTFYESKLIFTSFASEDDYDYMFYREILLNSGESTSKNVIVKILRFMSIQE